MPLSDSSTHHSTRRQRQAQATRADILAAARRLFAERGYAHVSMTDIAREADVATQTIYASVGSKRALVFALVELIDEESDVPALAGRITGAPTAHEALAAGVHLTRQMQERVGDVIAVLMSAGVVDADAAAAAAEGLARHRGGAATVAQRMSELDGLRDGVSVDEAAAAISVLTSTAVYTQFRGEFGWSFDECERWMLTTLADRLGRSAR
jgi:AcrR family transcriptional regulator